jgi:hypothetical protein
LGDWLHGTPLLGSIATEVLARNGVLSAPGYSFLLAMHKRLPRGSFRVSPASDSSDANPSITASGVAPLHGSRRSTRARGSVWWLRDAGVREPFQHRRKYVPVGSVGDILSPTLLKGLSHTGLTC